MEQSKTKPGQMDIHDIFRSSQDTIAKFAEMQVHLYRHDVSLQNYFHALDAGMFSGVPSSPSDRAPINPFLALPFHGADKASQILKPRKIKTEVLFCPTPYFGRNTENRFVARTLLGLAHTGAKILCLLSAYAPFRQELELALAAAGY